MKKILNKLLLSILICFTLTCNLSVVQAADKNASTYFVEILFDGTNKKLVYNVVEMNRTTAMQAVGVYVSGEKNIIDNINDGLSTFATKAANAIGTGICFLPNLVGGNCDGKWGDSIANAFSQATVGEFTATVTFPSRGTIETAANIADSNQAQMIVGDAVMSFNEAIAMYARYTKTTNESILEMAEKVSIAVEDKQSTLTGTNGSVSLTYGDAISKNSKAYKEMNKIIAKAEAGNYKMGTTKDDFVLLESEDDYYLLQYNFPTGYGEGQYRYGSVETDKYTNSNFSWKTVYDIAARAAGNEITADNGGFEKFDEPGIIESYLKEFALSIFNWGIRTLGFETVEDLILNRNLVNVSYYLGMMPYSWFQIANIVFWIFEIVAIFILLASVLKIVFTTNLQTISPAQQANLMDSVENLLISIFLLIAYVPIFYILAKINFMIVEMLDSVTGSATLVSISTLGWLVTLVSTMFSLVFVIKLNITYLTRAVTITLLHVVAPAAIASIAIQGYTNGTYFNKWWKEMFGAIFMQTFDAVVLTLFLLIMEYGVATNYWQGLLFIYMFGPLNKWFKQTFMNTTSAQGVSDQFSDEAAKSVGNTVQAGAAITTSVATGAIAGKKTLDKNYNSIENKGDNGSGGLKEGNLSAKEGFQGSSQTTETQANNKTSETSNVKTSEGSEKANTSPASSESKASQEKVSFKDQIKNKWNNGKQFVINGISTLSQSENVGKKIGGNALKGVTYAGKIVSSASKAGLKETKHQFVKYNIHKKQDDESTSKIEETSNTLKDITERVDEQTKVTENAKSEMDEAEEEAVLKAKQNNIQNKQLKEEIEEEAASSTAK